VCLGIPGEIRTIQEGPLRTGQVAFGGILKQVCLAYVPEAEVGDFVIVHAGFAITRLDTERAARVLTYLDELGLALPESEKHAQDDEDNR
jgi:hydrogenase expression/formation protein HypC